MAIDRREFLKRGAAISATAFYTPWLMSMLGSSCTPLKLQENINESELQSLLSSALNRGGDFSEVFIEEISSLSFELSENQITQATAGITGGVGVRTVDHDRNGYAYANGFNFSKALEAAETAAYIASGNSTTKIGEPQEQEPPNTVEMKVPLNSIPETQKMELIQSANDAARSYSPHVKQVDITYYDQLRRRKIANSYGLRIENEIPLLWVVIGVLAEKDGVRHFGRMRISAHQGYEFFDEHSVIEAAETAAKEAVTMLDAKPAPSGSMPVIMSPGWGGVLIHEAVGHGLEGDFIHQGTSIYQGKVGQKVGSSQVTLIDDSSWVNARGTTEFDDEGTPGQHNVLIEDGILKGYMHDRISAKMLDAKLTGNGRRESYRHYPMPRMTNTYLAPRDTNPQDIFADTKDGIFVKSLSGGSVDTISGQFNFIVREAYRVENGEVTYPVSGATLIGRGIDVLTNIDAVGNNLELGVGTCGKGQWVPVTAGMPTIRVASGILVGGGA